MRVYDGESLKDTDPKAKSYQEYRDYAGVDEGMNGLSTRFAFKILPRVQLRSCRSGGKPGPSVLRHGTADRARAVPQEQAERYLEFLKGYLIPKYAEFIGKEIRRPTLNPIQNMGRTFSTVMLPTRISGFRIRVSRSGYRAVV